MNVLPAEGLGIVVLTNAAPIGVPEAVCRSFFDLALNGKVERDWLGVFGEAIASRHGARLRHGDRLREAAVRPTAGARRARGRAYAGTYRNDSSGRSRSRESDGGLVLRLGPKQEPFALRHWDRDVFIYQPAGENAYGPSAVTFRVGADGKATAVTIENLDTTGQGTFERVAS